MGLPGIRTRRVMRPAVREPGVGDHPPIRDRVPPGLNRTQLQPDVALWYHSVPFTKLGDPVTNRAMWSWTQLYFRLAWVLSELSREQNVQGH
jgi:hypothetical protein